MKLVSREAASSIPWETRCALALPIPPLLTGVGVAAIGILFVFLATWLVGGLILGTDDD